MIAAAQSTSGLRAVLGIVVLLLMLVGIIVVVRWLLARLAPDPPRLSDLWYEWHERRRAEDRASVVASPPDIPAPQPPAALPPQPASPSQPPAAPRRPPGGSPPQTPVERSPGAPATVVSQQRPGRRPPPAHPDARCPPGSIERLGGAVAVSRLMNHAEQLVARSLASLPPDRWHVERGVLIASYRIPFVILGETGVFVVCGASAPPSWHHLIFVSQAAVQVQTLLPGYDGDVHGAYCRALATEEVAPRWWCQPARAGDNQRRTYHAGRGVWVMDLQWLVPWLEQHTPAGSSLERHGRGVGVKDLERLRAVAARPPARPPVPQLGGVPFVDTVPNI